MTPPLARPRRPGPLPRAALVAALAWAALAALPAGPAHAQAWARTAPRFAPSPAPSPAPEWHAPLPALPPLPALTPPPVRTAAAIDFGRHRPSPEVEHVARWVRHAGDNARLPFLIVDKVNATVFVFEADGRLRGADPALLGMGAGDRLADGTVGQSLSALRTQDRITPAGRYLASIGRDLKGQDILWIDYASALALHRVVKGTPLERRAERLQSPTPDDNRISYGCINVPVPFFENVVGPAFAPTGGVVYILPEHGTARELFGSYDVGSNAAPGVTAP